MQLTNRLNLPQLVVDAIKNDRYDSGRREHHGDKYITATQLVRPPQMNRLLWEHAAELAEDASERIWSLLGQSVHSVIERASTRLTEALVEQRLYAELDGWTISGQVDLFELLERRLSDFKVTSVWSVLDTDDMKTEWQQQLSILAWLLHKNGYEVAEAQIVAILRDWSRTKVKFASQGDSYPKEPVRVLTFDWWQADLTELWIQGRLAELEAAEVRQCTREEQWFRGGGYAAKKRGNKRASKLFDTYEDAVNWIALQQDFRKFEIEGREGESVRCESYCPVRAFCPQARGESQVMLEQLS